jgi:hypothetical protein
VDRQQSSLMLILIILETNRGLRQAMKIVIGTTMAMDLIRVEAVAIEEEENQLTIAVGVDTSRHLDIVKMQNDPTPIFRHPTHLELRHLRFQPPRCPFWHPCHRLIPLLMHC